MRTSGSGSYGSKTEASILNSETRGLVFVKRLGGPGATMFPLASTMDTAPSPKHKKKKKRKQQHGSPVEEETVSILPQSQKNVSTDQSPDTEEITQKRNKRRREDEERTEESPVFKKKKKKKKRAQLTESFNTCFEETTREINNATSRGKERNQGKKIKKRKKGSTDSSKDVFMTEVLPQFTEKRQERNTPNKELPLLPAEEAESLIPETEQLDVTEHSDSSQPRVEEAVLVELEELIPDIRTRAHDVVWKIYKYDLLKLRELKRQGLKLRWGKFTAQENLQIRKNVEDFLILTGIETVDELFFPHRYPEKKNDLKKVKGQHGFYQKIAEGLQRTSEQVYIRGKKIFDWRNYQGRFSEDELEALQKLHTLHGNSWKDISDQMDRCAQSCQARWAEMGFHKGPWTPEEQQKLQKVMRKHLKHLLKASPSSPSPGLNAAPSPEQNPNVSWVQLCSKIPWSKISRKVQTRSWVQCRAKWFSYLKSRLKVSRTETIPNSSAVQTRIKLIQILYEQRVEDVFEVDWIDVAKAVGGVTPVCVQRMFHRMKVSCVPGWTTQSFGEMVDVLFEKELPRLQRRLEKEQNPGLEPISQSDYLSLGRIFPTDSGEFRELDNS